MPPRNRSHGFRRPISSGPYTYAISDGTAIKIGGTDSHPITRLAELQVGNPRLLRLLAYTTHIAERRAHKLLHRYHVRGEWFSLECLAFLRDWDWLDEQLWKSTKETLPLPLLPRTVITGKVRS